MIVIVEPHRDTIPFFYEDKEGRKWCKYIGPSNFKKEIDIPEAEKPFDIFSEFNEVPKP